MRDLESEEKIATDIAKLERNLKLVEHINFEGKKRKFMTGQSITGMIQNTIWRKKIQELLLVALNIATVYSMH